MKNIYLVGMTVLSVSVQMMAMFIQKRNLSVLPVPNQKFNFKFTCGGVHQYEKRHLDLVVKTALEMLNSQLFYPASFDKFTYAANGPYWIYPILPDNQIYEAGLPIHHLDVLKFNIYHRVIKAIAPDEFVVFDKNGIIMGGVQYVLGTQSSEYLPCKFADQTVYQLENEYPMFHGQADSSHATKSYCHKKEIVAHIRKPDVIPSVFESFDSNLFSKTQDFGCNFQSTSHS